MLCRLTLFLIIFVISVRISADEPNNLSFGLSSSDSEEFTQQILGFSGKMNGQRPGARPKISRGASKLPEDEGEKPKTQVNRETRTKRYAFSFNYGLAPLSGFVQTPKGGMPGTTSHHRPTFHEVGIENSHIYSARIEADWPLLFGFFEVEMNNPKGDSILDEPLITHDLTIPAMEYVRVKYAFNLYSFGFGYPLYSRSLRLYIRPEISLIGMGFSYEVASLKTPSIRTSRNFAAGSLQVGALGRVYLSPHLFSQLEVRSSIPKLCHLSVYSIAARLQFLMQRKRVGEMWFYLGARYQFIVSRDHQTVPNQKSIHMGPYPLFGLEYRF